MKEKAKNYTNIVEFSLAIILVALAVFLCLNKATQNSVTEGLKLFYACVIPSLFPYFFITACLSGLNITSKLSSKLSPLSRKIFGVDGNVFFALLMSIISGYPLGAKMVGDLASNGLISENQRVKASILCSTSSPMFLIGAVGRVMFNSVTFGLLLFLTHLLTIIVIGIILSFIGKKTTETTTAPTPFKKADNLIYEAVYNSVISILVVGGIIVVFYLLTDVLYITKILSPIVWVFNLIFNDKNLAKGVTFGLFECTKGLKYISTAPSSLLTLPICALLCGFGGFSVIVQSICHLKRAKIKTAPFLISKIVSAVLNFVIGFVLSLIFLNQ